jgi:hypothetical protein
LHVLSTPPAFILSQDQTLQLNFRTYYKGTTKRAHYLVFKDQKNIYIILFKRACQGFF